MRAPCMCFDGPERLEPDGHAALPTPSIEDCFGTSVDMSLDGRTLKISSFNPDGDFDIPQFRTHIFVRPANTWRFSVTLAPFDPR